MEHPYDGFKGSPCEMGLELGRGVGKSKAVFGVTNYVFIEYLGIVTNGQ